MPNRCPLASRGYCIYCMHFHHVKEACQIHAMLSEARLSVSDRPIEGPKVHVLVRRRIIQLILFSRICEEMATTTTLLENLSEQQRGSRSRRSSSRRSSGGSDSSRSSISSTLSTCSSSSTESCGSSDGIVKGLTILGVCLLYAFMLFFIASVTTALSYVFRFRNKGK